MEELLLRAVLPRQELHVVDEQDVDGAVLMPKLTHAGCGDGADHLVGELLRREVNDSLAREAVMHLMPDGVHQVCLAETYASVDEKWVVAVARRLGHGLRGCVRELRVVAHDEGRELETRIEVGRQDRTGVMPSDAVLVTVVARGIGSVWVGGEHRRPVPCWRDHEVDVHLSAGDRLQRLLDETGEAILQPVLRQLAGYADAERAAISRHHRGVFEPHVIGALGELKPELLLDLRPDLVLVHLLTSPSLCPAASGRPGRKLQQPLGQRLVQMLWISWGSGLWSRRGVLPVSGRADGPERACWFNRQSLTDRIRLPCVCGKDQTGFPQASLPARYESSLPACNYCGSGAVALPNTSNRGKNDAPLSRLY